jgi:hypothetical protein
MEYVIRVVVMSEKSCWNLNGDIRPLLISQEIINILDNFKLKLSNTLVFNRILESTTTKNVCGYSIVFEIVDGVSNIDDK